MDLSFRHDPWIRRLPTSPRDEGRVAGLVVRPGDEGARELVERARLEVGRGVVGDRWAKKERERAGNEVSLINVHLIAALTDGDPQRMALSGDNLQVDLDLSEANLPVGTRLAIGAAVLEVSPAPHRPCRSFHGRFGATAAKRVARANRLGLRGRGVLCTVLEGGDVRVGDAIRVLRPS